METFLPLVHGASIVFVDDKTRIDGYLLLDKIKKEKITMMWGTPTIYQILMDSGWQELLPIKILIGGEPVPKPLALKIQQRCNELWNIYGPTETTVCCILTKIAINDDPITIGTPLANTQIYLLDKDGNPVPKGEVGEIAIGGEGVSMGYLHRPELNTQYFVHDPFSKVMDRKMYLSGDLGKLLPNGQIQCLGRRDGQVKIRGHRIELGEVEEALKKLVGVHAAAADAKDNILKAYVVYFGKETDWNDSVLLWKERLTKEFPSYMVPQEFVRLAEIPMTKNGKLDRKRLSEFESTALGDNSHTEPRTEAEMLVADIWKECLRLKEVDIFANFFALGGHSMIAAKVMTLLEKKTGKRLPLASLFEHSTVEKLARLIEVEEPHINWDSLVPIRVNGNKTPIFIVHGGGLNVLKFQSLTKYMDPEQPIYGLQPKGLNGVDTPLETVEEMAAHYIDCVYRAQPKGPYNLGGYSFGGIVAYEMARQLIAQGERIYTLALFDTDVFPTYIHKSHLAKKVAFGKYLVEKKHFAIKKMLGSKQGFHEKTNALKYRVNRFLTRTQLMDPDLGQANEILEINDRALSRYHLIPISVKIDLFRAEEINEYMQDTEFYGWKPLAKKGIAIHDTPGDHRSIFTPPHDKVLAKILQKVLDGKEGQSEPLK